MYTPSALTTNLNKNKPLPLKQPTIGGQIIPQRPTDNRSSSSMKPNDSRISTGPSALGAQPGAQLDQLPRWNNEEIDRRLAESAKLLQEWTDLMNKTDGQKAEEVSPADLRRHYELKRKLHDNLGTMAKIVQVQLKIVKRADGTTMQGIPSPALGALPGPPIPSQSLPRAMPPNAPHYNMNQSTLPQQTYQQQPNPTQMYAYQNIPGNAQGGPRPRLGEGGGSNGNYPPPGSNTSANPSNYSMGAGNSLLYNSYGNQPGRGQPYYLNQNGQPLLPNAQYPIGANSTNPSYLMHYQPQMINGIPSHYQPAHQQMMQQPGQNSNNPMSTGSNPGSQQQQQPPQHYPYSSNPSSQQQQQQFHSSTKPGSNSGNEAGSNTNQINTNNNNTVPRGMINSKTPLYAGTNPSQLAAYSINPSTGQVTPNPMYNYNNPNNPASSNQYPAGNNNPGSQNTGGSNNNPPQSAPSYYPYYNTASNRPMQQQTVGGYPHPNPSNDQAKGTGGAMYSQPSNPSNAPHGNPGAANQVAPNQQMYQQTIGGKVESVKYPPMPTSQNYPRSVPPSGYPPYQQGAPGQHQQQSQGGQNKPNPSQQQLPPHQQYQQQQLSHQQQQYLHQQQQQQKQLVQQMPMGGAMYQQYPTQFSSQIPTSHPSQHQPQQQQQQQHMQNFSQNMGSQSQRQSNNGVQPSPVLSGQPPPQSQVSNSIATTASNNPPTNNANQPPSTTNK